MYPKIVFHGFIIPTYTICYCMGFIASVYLLCKLLVKKRLLNRYIVSLTISLLGLLAGSRLFGFLSRLLSIYQSTHKWEIQEALNSGIVYLGGLLGYLSTFYVLCKFKKSTYNNSDYDVANVLAVAIPLFHFFGRLGCFFSGCCYGKISTSIFAIQSPTIDSNTIDSRIPVQLIEATLELILFVIFYKIYCDNSANGLKHHLLLHYLTVYCIIRFLLEFFRGDEIRGVYFGISFSQYVCIIVLVTIYTQKYYYKWRKKCE